VLTVDQPGLSGWESLVTALATVAIPAYSAIEASKAQKTATESAAQTARLQMALDAQRLAVETRNAQVMSAQSSPLGVSSKHLPLIVGGGLAAVLLAYFALRR